MSRHLVALRKALLLNCAAVAISGGLFGASAQESKTYNIPEQSLSTALRQFTVVSGRNLLFAPELVQGRTAHRVSGSFADEEALELLLSGSNLEFAATPSGALVLRPKTLLNKVADVAAGPAAAPSTGPAQAAAAPAPDLEEVVVTGSRIVREGYEAPTPLTVIGIDDLLKSADGNVTNLLATMPALAGVKTAGNSSGLNGNGGLGLQSMNLRALGSNRVLVLLDGQRVVPSLYEGYVDVGTFPQQLLARVDVVTGGASAVYGSDAVTGVVNFILDKELVGIRGEVSGGVTNYGDAKNYKIELSAGLPFASGRGHVLLSGQHMHSDGISGDGGRSWNREGWLQYNNPAWTATNGLPRTVFLPQSSLSTATAGGIIVSGPLKGTAFGAGGTPYQFGYGPIVSGDFMQGGDWQSNMIGKYADLEPRQDGQRFFTRLSYDLADNVTAFAQYSFAQSRISQALFKFWLPAGGGPYTLRNDNAYLPASVRAAMATAGVTTIQFGSWNDDMGMLSTRILRMNNRVSAGFDGSFDAGDSTWTWNAYYAYGATKSKVWENNIIRSRYLQAIDAVFSSAGQIVCRNPADGCQPWSALGVGVNDNKGSAFNWMIAGGGSLTSLIEMTTMAASISGEPFSLWAGPVSLAFSAEHRKDEINGAGDPASAGGLRNIGNFPALRGKLAVTEGAVEAVIPLAADESWAQGWDVSLAARATDYEYSGYVTTWKIGSTYTLTDDLKLRFTRSRDIRAPNIQDLFAELAVNASPGSADPFRNNVITPYFTARSGNLDLSPEKSDTTGIGVVLTPQFLGGFTASVDYWDVKVKDAIQAFAANNIINACFNGVTAMCPLIHRDSAGVITQVDTKPVNVAVENVRGVDLEASYRTALSDVVSDTPGDISFHGLMTFYLKAYLDNRFNPATDRVGVNVDTATTTGGGAPDWKLTGTVTYRVEPLSFSLTGRAFSAGTLSATAVACTTGCPANTVDRPTVDTNYAPGRFYLDASVNYGVEFGDTATADVFVSARNLFDAGVPPIPTQYYRAVGGIGSLYELQGAVFRAGIRFKM